MTSTAPVRRALIRVAASGDGAEHQPIGALLAAPVLVKRLQHQFLPGVEAFEHVGARPNRLLHHACLTELFDIRGRDDGAGAVCEASSAALQGLGGAQDNSGSVGSFDRGKRIPERPVRGVALLVHHAFDAELHSSSVAGRAIMKDDTGAQLQRHGLEVGAHLVRGGELRHDLHVGVEVEQAIVDT